MRALVLSCLVVASAGCDLEERSDFLVGRSCDPDVAGSCDPEQSCLPHRFDRDNPADYRCRSVESFEPLPEGEPPLAYCDPQLDLICPGDLVCNADRVRQVDGGVRRRVCQRPGTPFGPPS